MHALRWRTGMLLRRNAATWTRLPVNEGPLARCAPGAAYDRDRRELFIVGGDSDSPFGAALADLWSLDTTTLTWRPRAKIEIPRYYSSLISVPGQDKLVMFGGSTSKGEKRLGDLCVYNIQTDTWQEVQANSKGLQPRDQHGVAVVGTDMFVFGGRTPEGPTNEMLRLNLLTYEWETLFAHSEDFGPRPRGGATLNESSDGRYLYMFGGWGVQDRCVWEFDIEEKEWVKKVPKLRTCSTEGTNPSAVRGPQGWGHSSVVFTTPSSGKASSDVLLIYGGVELSETTSEPAPHCAPRLVWKNELWAFNTKENTLSEVINLPQDAPLQGLSAHCAFALDRDATLHSQFIVYGGTRGLDTSYSGPGHRDLMESGVWTCTVPTNVLTQAHTSQTDSEVYTQTQVAV